MQATIPLKLSKSSTSPSKNTHLAHGQAFNRPLTSAIALHYIDQALKSNRLVILSAPLGYNKNIIFSNFIKKINLPIIEIEFSVNDLCNTHFLDHKFSQLVISLEALNLEKSDRFFILIKQKKAAPTLSPIHTSTEEINSSFESFLKKIEQEKLFDTAKITIITQLNPKCFTPNTSKKIEFKVISQQELKLSLDKMQQALKLQVNNIKTNQLINFTLRFSDGWPLIVNTLTNHLRTITQFDEDASPDEIILDAHKTIKRYLFDFLLQDEILMAAALSTMDSLSLDTLDYLSKTSNQNQVVIKSLVAKSIFFIAPDDKKVLWANRPIQKFLRNMFCSEREYRDACTQIITSLENYFESTNNHAGLLELNANMKNWQKTIQQAKKLAQYNEKKIGSDDQKSMPLAGIKHLKMIPQSIRRNNSDLQSIISFDKLIEKVRNSTLTRSSNNTSNNTSGNTANETFESTRLEGSDLQHKKLTETSSSTEKPKLSHRIQKLKSTSKQGHLTQVNRIESEILVNGIERLLQTDQTAKSKVDFATLENNIIADSLVSVSTLLDCTNYINKHDLTSLLNTSRLIIEQSRHSTRSEYFLRGVLSFFYACWQSGNFKDFYAMTESISQNENHFPLSLEIKEIIQLCQTMLLSESGCSLSSSAISNDDQMLYLRFFNIKEQDGETTLASGETEEEETIVYSSPTTQFTKHYLSAMNYLKQDKPRKSIQAIQEAKSSQFLAPEYIHSQLFPLSSIQFDLLINQSRVDEALSLVRHFQAQDQNNLAPRIRVQLAFYQLIKEKNNEAHLKLDECLQSKGLIRDAAYNKTLHTIGLFIQQNNKGAVKEFINTLNYLQEYPFRRLLLDFGPIMAYLILYAQRKEVDHPLIDELSVHAKKLIDQEIICTKLLDLSKREIEILSLITCGYSNEDIAGIICRSLGTVKLHVHSVYKKLAIHSRVQAIKKCQNSGFFYLQR